ncbi:MAG TPA: hypothetical protein VFN18_07340 [Solirubrobacterales bacterium]|nr:hypothetical protein [Solirubrobacterales bacterium]
MRPDQINASLALLPTARLNQVRDLARIGGVGAAPNASLAGVDLNKSLRPLGAAGIIDRLGTANRWEPSPAAMGHLWSKPGVPKGLAGDSQLGTHTASMGSTVASEGLDVDGVADAAWDYAGRVGQWAQSLPDANTRSVVLHLGGVLISLAATAITMHEGGGGQTAVAALGMIFAVAMWINALIDKIQK